MTAGITGTSPPTLDGQALACWLARAPARSPWLHEEVGRRMAERLQWFVRRPRRWLDWEPVRGGAAAHALVAQRYGDAECWLWHGNPLHAQEALRRWRPSLWRRLRGGPVHFEAPPSGCLDMVWANMALHLAPDPAALMRQWGQWLGDEGFVMFSTFGPDTLIELRGLYAQARWPEPAQAFTDMHDLGDMLVANGFAEPVMDMEHIRLQFPSAERVLVELRELGRNLHVDRFAGLRGRRWHRALCEALQQLTAADGTITLTFEIVYGHAFKARPRAASAQHSAIPLGDVRAALRRAKAPSALQDGDSD
ncbi:hypothetical protein AAV94_08005 [Lampropedia cohaerens]|uniref:Biotin synthase n=1 Tax=Lampropedia cohaerens TaxID=1610491 RepID=A0A0U1PZC5_9BURK|nr:methyltransferase domain-containing protein [Lampropedia cohaerens]KKW67864.1 hypothetical protein AAV94_08005 [Lampropedia cohaerens]